MKRKLGILVIITLLLINNGCQFKIPVLQIPEPSVLYDAHGQEICSLYRQKGIQVGLNEISDYLEKATIAAEDRNFYRHHGVDIWGVLRAFYINLRHGRVIAGGSTITQQTAKTLFLTNERTIIRKIKELYYTFLLESRYSKNEILELYLNSIYYGEGATGIEAAARTYFDKSAANLDLAESALLAGIPQRPSYYDPYKYPQHAKKRQEIVLDLMVKNGYISEKEARAARKEKLVYRRGENTEGPAPYFVQMVVDYLVDKYGAPMVFGGGLRVVTTIDLKMQEAAEKAYNNVMKNQNPDLQAALVAVDTSNGYIRAVIGGRNFKHAPFNRALEGRRQPGSAFKPFLYSKALELGYTEASMFMCEPVTFSSPGSPDYTPTDYGDEPYHYRAFTLKEAIMVSDNVVSVRLNQAVGPENTALHAKKFGFKGAIRPVLSLALGTSEVTPLEMASAYAVFANGGTYYPPVFISRVSDSRGVVLEENRSEGSRVISEENAYLVTDMLKGVLEPGGTASHLKEQVGRPAAGKTGTTQDYRDAWFVGYTPELSCAVWVGYDTPARSVGIPGGRIAGPIWAEFTKNALRGVPPRDFKKPDDIVQVNICMDSGAIASEYCPRQMQASFISGTEPQYLCPVHRPVPDWWEWMSWQRTHDGENSSDNNWNKGLRKWLHRFLPWY